MCYTATSLIKKALKRARHNREPEEVEHFEKQLKDVVDQHQVSGFAHPRLITYTNEALFNPQLSIWGLIPSWVKDEKQAKDMWNKTLNARSETIFEKPSFRESAKNKRCIIPLGGFFEHHHYNKKKYPFFIHPTDDEPLNVAGLWNSWVNKQTGEVFHTCSIVTTSANELMAKIHNGAKESRMPAILEAGAEDEWLSENSKEKLQELLKPFPEEYLEAHTVKPLSGKNSPGNVPEACEHFEYEELEF